MSVLDAIRRSVVQDMSGPHSRAQVLLEWEKGNGHDDCNLEAQRLMMRWCIVHDIVNNSVAFMKCPNAWNHVPESPDAAKKAELRKLLRSILHTQNSYVLSMIPILVSGISLHSQSAAQASKQEESPKQRQKRIAGKVARPSKSDSRSGESPDSPESSAVGVGTAAGAT
ncbi:hypothetical protein WN51_11176 [Melipona quadrifasciata]|uniref:Uncharacterized protein n=1 Tax=Melipona quadrifasciata TaxID=166423 RepID=A0A0M9A6H4_9HYME|nr:hypothetical protein WN51_11176 [Melipona quadrifasciata]